jgi:hypothetical protein
LNAHCAKVSSALLPLLKETVTEKKHQEVLPLVFSLDTKFDKPCLNFIHPNLALLVKFGIHHVVVETPACSQGQVR